MTLLVVEDNPGMRRVIRTTVSDLALVVECSAGEDALEAYRRYCPDWVLMDIKMGAMNGITATRSIKAAFPAARIVILTNYDDAELREAARRAGACGYVLKENLIEVRRILGGGQ